MQRDNLGKFARKNDEHRSVRSLRLTDTTWSALGVKAESLSLTRADLLEQMVRSNNLELPLERGAGFVGSREESDPAGDVIKPAPLSWQDSDHPHPSNTRKEQEIPPRNTPIKAGLPPSNTRKEQEIERILVEVTHLREENAKLLERVAVQLPQVKELEARRDRVLSSLKLGKQAPGYKKALSVLNQFIELSLTDVVTT